LCTSAYKDSGESESSDFEVDPDDDGGEDTSWSTNAWKDDPEDWSVPGPYHGNATFAFEEFKACKDPNKGCVGWPSWMMI